MKARVTKAALVDTIGWVAQVMPKRYQAPAMAGIRLSIDGGDLVLYAFDYETSHRATVPAEGITTGECLVPGAFLKNVVTSMPGATIELVLERGTITASAGRSTYRAPVLNLDDYPTLPEFPTSAGETTAEALGFVSAAVDHAVDPATTVEALTALHIEAGDGDLYGVGTDRFVLAAASLPWTGRAFEANVTSRALAAAVKGLHGTVLVGHDDGLLGLADDRRTVTMRCLATEYPQWQRLIRPPSEDAVVVEVETAEVLDAVKRTAKMLGSENRAIVVSVRQGELEFSVETSEEGAGNDVVECDVDVVSGNGEIRLGMNPHMLAEALAATASDRVVIGFGPDAKKPLMLRPVDHSRAEFVVMPRTIMEGTAR